MPDQQDAKSPKAGPAAGQDPRAKLRHDLRTPVNHIIGYSELLQEEAKDRGQEDFIPDLRKIQAAARRLIEMLDAAFATPGATEAQAPKTEAPAGPAPPAGAAAAPPAPLARTRARESGPAAAGAGSLLVVDDNEMNRDMLSRRLRARGYTVAVAEDGTRALEMLEQKPCDLILLDVMMPGLSGLDVLRIVREKVSLADLPIIMATAKDSSEDIVEALKLGANDYVTKPLDFPVVLARVQAQLALKFATDEIQRLAADLEVRNKFIRNTFGRYLSDEIVASILESPEGLTLGGESRKVTIMMSDLRGFTSMSERLGPEQVVHMLNTYLGAMADIIMEHQGTIDEFIGDAILAIFGAPISREDDAQRALACAISMQLAMEAVNTQYEAEGLPRLEMGIAVHTGRVVVGNIGSQKRVKYGIVGSPVNLTGRIESYTVGNQILVSEATLLEAGSTVRVGQALSVKAKGSSEPITVHDLRGIGGEYDVFLPEKEDRLLPLPKEVPIRYCVVEGKHIGERVYEGGLQRLSATGAEVRPDSPLESLSNVKINVSRGNGEEVPGDLYAKVTAETATSTGCVRLRFTSVPPRVEAFLRELLAPAPPD